MAKIMEQPIVDFLRQQLNFSGFPLPSVSEDEIILLFMSRIVISKIVNCLNCFNMLQSVMRILIFYGQTMLILASLNLLSSTPIIIWLLLLNVSLKLQIIVAKNCEKKESLFEILKLLAGIPWKVLYITPSICLLITM